MNFKPPPPTILTTGLLMWLFGCSSAPTDPSAASDEGFVIEPQVAHLSSLGDSTSLRAVQRDQHGRESSCPNVRWQSLDEAVATVNGSGKVKARAAGIAAIIAACGAAEARASVQVIEVTGAGLRAFPEAEGWGAGALNSCRRGGTEVLRVTNLNDAGSGSLRAAVEASQDDRLSIVVFRVAGYLDLQSDIELRGKSCLYFAGQTAPGDGITIRRSPGRAFYIKGASHDIVFRHLRFRGGYAGNYRGHVGIQVGSGENYVLDHLSMGWTTDKALIIKKSATSWSNPISRVSVQRSIMAEIFADHPTGVQISGENDYGATDWRLIQDLSLHRNLFAHNSHRNPNVTTYGTEVINNVIYNWRMGAVQSTRESKLDVISNVFDPGPMTDSRYLYEVTWTCDHPGGYEPSLHVEGNIGPHSDDPAADNWNGASRMTACYYKTGGDPGVELPNRFRRDNPLPRPLWPVAVRSAAAVRDDVLGDVGASAGLACDGGWVARADAADRRVIGDARNATGPAKPPENESQVGGFPSLDPGQACSDGDGDGMPDAFESRFGFDPDNPFDAAHDADGDGYSNIEEYINVSLS